jgi:hypothetical protein
MFLMYLKNFYTKKIIKNNLSNVTPKWTANKIEKIGIIIDESLFDKSELILSSLIERGYLKSQISVVIYKDKIDKNQSSSFPIFENKDITWFANIKPEPILNFISQEFDLLINYYEEEKSPLLLVSNLSKATFKVGFLSIDKRINHFMIATTMEEQTLFIEELFRYLKILNKI